MIADLVRVYMLVLYYIVPVVFLVFDLAGWLHY